ncbi:MAG TPA: DUF4249 family protein [Bacteroidales bacterium]|nr:DUF4249 family protein [Bacteroidales bacterium]
MRKLFFAGLFIISLITWTCSEVYDPEDIDTSEPILVVQGMVQYGEFPQVTLTWARNYGQQTPDYVSGATITIEDDFGRSTIFEEISAGQYTAYGIVGDIGQSYRLIVRLADSSLFQSNWQRIERIPQIDRIYAEPGEYKILYYNSSGEPMVQNQVGLQVKCDLSDYSQSTVYYRFNTRMVKLMVKTEDIGSPASHGVYMWETHSMDNTYTVDYTTLSNNRQLLLQHNIGFLRYFYDATLETETSTAPFTEGWILTCDIYSISKDVYSYYNSINKQLNPDNQIFAPATSQVKSNMSYVAGSVTRVAGVFEACAKLRIYKGFAWKSKTEYRTKDLYYFPEVGSGSQERLPPDFWIYF